MPTLSDLELLQIEMDLLWGTGPAPELVVACARDGLRSASWRAMTPVPAPRSSTRSPA
jgi:hypothetical protein